MYAYATQMPQYQYMQQGQHPQGAHHGISAPQFQSHPYQVPQQQQRLVTNGTNQSQPNPAGGSPAPQQRQQQQNQVNGETHGEGAQKSGTLFEETNF